MEDDNEMKPLLVHFITWNNSTNPASRPPLLISSPSNKSAVTKIVGVSTPKQGNPQWILDVITNFALEYQIHLLLLCHVL